MSHKLITKVDVSAPLVLTSLERREPVLLQILIRSQQTLSSFPALVATLLAASVYVMCREGVADPDIWWHLRNSQYLLANLRFPNFDTYSFTAAGSHWVNHEWLSALFYYVGFSAFGLRGIVLVLACALAALFIGTFWVSFRESRDPFAAAIATFTGILLAKVGFSARTQHFGWLCFVGIYAILLSFRSGKRAPLWLIPILFCVWINCHGSWPFGLIVYGIFVSAGLICRDLGQLKAAPWSSRELKQLLVIGFASIAALFVNPFGYHLVVLPTNWVFRQNLGVGSVEEWASVNFNDARGKVVILLVGVLFAMALSGRRRWRIDDALLTSFVLYCGLTHIRFLLLAGLVLPPILAGRLGQISSYDPGRERRVLNSALLAILMCGCVLAFPSAKTLKSVVEEYLPAGGTEFLRSHPQQGNMFNCYGWGGYIEWNLPTVRTFIDSRSDIFEYKGVLKDYLDIITLTKSQELLDRYRIAYILYPAGSGLPYFLSKSPRWERIYGDERTVIYRRRK